MAKKANLLEEAKKLGLDVSEKNTVAQIEAAIVDAETPAVAVSEAVSVDDDAEVTEAVATTTDLKVAKAGKRSAKAIAETEAK